MDCTDTVLICFACDPTGGFDRGNHKKKHTLLKVQEIIEKEQHANEFEIKILESINTLESKVNGLHNSMHCSSQESEAKIGSLEDKFGDRLNTLEERFSKVEGLLEQLLSQRMLAES